MLLPTDCQRLDILQQPGVRSCFLEGAQPGRSADLRTIGMRSSSRPYDLAALEFADDDLAGLSDESTPATIAGPVLTSHPL